MTDVHTLKQRSYNMSRIKSKNTNPERVLRTVLYASGARGYRIHPKIVGNPDVVFVRKKLAIFIDGCFWHRCPDCFIMPENNREFWIKKIKSNVERDKKVNLILKRSGWKVIRIWEHEIRYNLNSCCKRILCEVKKDKNGSQNT
ncbi:MAG TPA: very short patch repair endonuclease [Candidatus Omnitrophota bacterium]|nr:very short patch repair endonuclease [Candidatus Omnitrophota bacterium]